MCTAAGLSLLAPGSWLDRMWRIKPLEHAQLLQLGPIVAIGFLVLAGTMAAASIGSFGRRRWGWRLAIAIFLANGLADAARMAMGDPIEGAFGVGVTAAIIWWLTRSQVKAVFDR